MIARQRFGSRSLAQMGNQWRFGTIVDTGYNGELTMPSAATTALGPRWRRRGRAILADGRSTTFDVYEAQVLWDGTLRSVVVDAADADPLVGMALLSGYQLTINAVPSGAVAIVALA